MRAIQGFFAATGLILLTGCGQVSLVGSGTIVTETPTIEDFTKVDASHAFTVTISAGADFSVLVRADDNVMEHVAVTKNGDALVLDLRESSYSMKGVTLEAEVTMPRLSAVSLSGASSAAVAGFESSEMFSARLSGASELTGALKSGDAQFDLSGASSATVTGLGGALRVEASGASSATLSEFAVADCDVELSGASWVSVNPTGTLNAEASGASTVVYSGNPTIDKREVSGSSSIAAK